MEMAFVILDPRKPCTITILPEHAEETDSTPLTWNCADCGVNTHPGAKGRKGLVADLAARGKSRIRFDDRSEVYIVRPAVWKRAGVAPFGGCLCIGCLEKRLGRKLKPKDFNWKSPVQLHARHEAATSTPRTLASPQRLRSAGLLGHQRWLLSPAARIDGESDGNG